MPVELTLLAETLLSLVKPQAHILDIGCGAGRDIAWFEMHSVKITGADLSWGMLQEARQHTHSGLIQNTMQQLAFKDKTFDAVWANASLLHLPKLEAPHTLAEFHRVLCTPGILILTIQAGEGETWESGYGNETQRFFARYQEAEMKDLLAQSLFNVRECQTVYAGPKTWLQFICVAC